jgi:hypothetical protein
MRAVAIEIRTCASANKLELNACMGKHTQMHIGLGQGKCVVSKRPCGRRGEVGGLGGD